MRMLKNSEMKGRHDLPQKKYVGTMKFYKKFNEKLEKRRAAPPVVKVRKKIDENSGKE